MRDVSNVAGSNVENSADVFQSKWKNDTWAAAAGATTSTTIGAITNARARILPIIMLLPDGTGRSARDGASHVPRASITTERSWEAAAVGGGINYGNALQHTV